MSFKDVGAAHQQWKGH